jgi:carboxylesterase type B
MIKKMLLVCLILLLHQVLFSQVKKQTFAYAVKNSDTLSLDVYSSPAQDSIAKAPCVLFVFGGAFIGGGFEVFG